MKRTFLIGVAAGALLASANIASAQMERGGAAGGEQRGGATMEQRGGAGGGGSEMRGGAEQRGGGTLEQRGPAASSPSDRNNRAQSQDNKSTTGQGEPRREQGQRQEMQRGQDTQRQEQRGQEQRDRDAQRGQQDRGQSAQQERDRSGGATSGQGAGGGARAANLTVEQKTKIRDTVIRAKDAPRVTNVNFNVSVGTVVPRTVRYAPLSPALVEIYPEWRSYYYIIVNDEIVIIEPSSFKIVTVVNV